MRKFFGLNFQTGLLIGCAIAAAIAAAAIAYERYDTKTLKRTIRRDAVFCGVNTGLPGFSSVDDKDNWSGFDVDFCRAIAADGNLEQSTTCSMGTLPVSATS